MVNMAKLGLVMECDEKTLTFYHERKVFVVDRTEAFATTMRANWVIFKTIDGQVKMLRPYNKKKWNARVSPDNDILLDVNAQLRDENCYPMLKRAGIETVDPVKEALWKRPWSFELDWLEDEKNKMARTRKSWFHEVTVKFVYEKDEMGAYKFRFPILEVHYESETEMQMKGQFTPWIEEIVKYSQPPQETSTYKHFVERDNKNPNKKSMMYGIIVRQVQPGNRTVVWSMQTGEYMVRKEAMDRVLLMPGEFVHFRLKRSPTSIYINRIEKSPRVLKKTDYFEKTPEERLAKVLVEFPIPEQHLVGPRGMLKIHDNFLGEIEISAAGMARLLQKHGYSLPQVYGRLLKVWVIPSTQIQENRNLTVAKYWEPYAVHEDVFSTNREV